jgi:hypothetical protein
MVIPYKQQMENFVWKGGNIMITPQKSAVYEKEFP